MKGLLKYLILILLTGSAVRGYACSPLLTPTLVSQAIVGPDLQLMWSSNTIYNNCPYTIDVEIVCDNGSFLPTGPFFTTASYTKNTTPWALPMQSINISGLCAGTIYKFRAREVYNVATFSPWTATFTFTTPGVFVQPTITLSATPPTVCVPANSQLNCVINNSCGGTPPTYLWTPATFLSSTTIANPVCTPTATTTYTCTVTGGQLGCWTASSTITITSGAAIATVAPATVCIGGCAPLTASGAVTYTWSPATALSATTGANVTACPTITTTYTVTGTDITGCTGSTTVVVTVNPALSTTAVVAPNPICIGSSATLTANGSGGSGTGYNYVWSPGNLTGSSVTVSPTSTTTYTVTITDDCTTPAGTQTVTLTVNPLPVISSIPPVAGCVPYCYNFTDLTPNAINWTWGFMGGVPITSNTSPSGQICWDTPGTYNVILTLTDNNGCTNTATVTTVTVHPNPVAAFTMISDSASILNPDFCFINTSQLASTYNWDFGFPASQNNNSTLPDPCFQYNDTGIYCVKLVATSQYQCVDSVTECVYVIPFFALYVPNAFTPDGNATNNFFFPVGDGVDPARFEMWIYDRWGNNIWHTTQWGDKWDGRANGGTKLVQEDVYVWKIKLFDFLNKEHVYVGHVSVIR